MLCITGTAMLQRGVVRIESSSTVHVSTLVVYLKVVGQVHEGRTAQNRHALMQRLPQRQDAWKGDPSVVQLCLGGAGQQGRQDQCSFW